MEIKFLQKDQPNWLAYADQIASVDWKAAAFVANKMRQRSYNDWEGVFVAVAHNQLAGFCTIVKEDIVPLQVAPFIATVYVAPSYRGNHLSQQLVSAAERRLHQIGFDTIYIVTQLTGLYEKLGYQKIETATDRFGRRMRVLAKNEEFC
ncbi:GNAT family N-acetyltransferase [Enterococcus gallinarum]|uniref:GNAT family N-acetyltransferase n=1 Tax=Enterococcus TaxID=1350 RepID=UPI00391A1157